jgi:hypothetical protein
MRLGSRDEIDGVASSQPLELDPSQRDFQLQREFNSKFNLSKYKRCFGEEHFDLKGELPESSL